MPLNPAPERPPKDDQLIDLPREPGFWLCRLNVRDLEGPSNAILEISGQPPYLKPYLHGLEGANCPEGLCRSCSGKYRIRLGPRLLPDRADQRSVGISDTGLTTERREEFDRIAKHNSSAMDELTKKSHD